MSSNKMTLLAGALGLAAAALLAGCGGGSKPEAHPANAPEKAPVRVTVTKAAKETWPAGVELTGTVRARTTTDVAARAMGYIRELRPQTGDRVTEGQVIAIIDSRDLDAGVKQAEAAETEARSAIAEVETAGRAAKAQLDLARVTNERMRTLFQKNSISKQEMDEADMRLRVAESGVEAVASKRKQLDAKIAQAQEGVRLAKVNLGFAEVRAPFAGVVIARKAEPGTLASPGLPLLTLERAGAFRAEITVDESKIRDIKAGSTAALTIEALDQNITARVTEVVPAVQADSRGFVVKLDLPASPNLRSGLFVRARFDTGTRSVLAVDAAAMKADGQLQSVLVADNGVARERMVRTGDQQQGKVEILSGLQEGDLIITAASGARDGDRVEVKQ